MSSWLFLKRLSRRTNTRLFFFWRLHSRSIYLFLRQLLKVGDPHDLVLSLDFTRGLTFWRHLPLFIARQTPFWRFLDFGRGFLRLQPCHLCRNLGLLHHSRGRYWRQQEFRELFVRNINTIVADIQLKQGVIVLGGKGVACKLLRCFCVRCTMGNGVSMGLHKTQIRNFTIFKI